jgi:hypothetical protein
MRLAAYATIIVLPVIFQQSQRILGRKIVDAELGSTALGLWESVIKLQEGYIQVIGSVLVILLLPRFIQSPLLAHKEATRFSMQAAVALLIAAAVTVPLGRHILSILYTAEAADADVALSLNITSDVARSSYTTLQLVLLSQERFMAFVSMEFIAAASLLTATAVGASVSLERVFGLYVVQGLAITSVALIVSKTTGAKRLKEI